MVLVLVGDDRRCNSIRHMLDGVGDRIGRIVMIVVVIMLAVIVLVMVMVMIMVIIIR